MVELVRANTVFHISDMTRSQAFYIERLGFAVDFSLGEPPIYAGLHLGEFYLHLGTQLPGRSDRGHGNIYLIFDEVDALFARLQKTDTTIIRPVADQEFGLRDFVIQDPDGNQIGIASPLE